MTGIKGVMSSKGATGGHELKPVLLELQIPSKKNILDIFNNSFLSIVVGRDHSFLFSLKEASRKKVWETLIYWIHKVRIPLETDSYFKL